MPKVEGFLLQEISAVGFELRHNGVTRMIGIVFG